jgi:uncharacterized protein YdcH (DUF465 family)
MMMEAKTLIRLKHLQEKHKILDRECTDLEKVRDNDRTTAAKYELVEKKKEKLRIRDEINRIKQANKEQ